MKTPEQWKEEESRREFVRPFVQVVADIQSDARAELLQDYHRALNDLAAFVKQLDAGDPAQAMAALLKLKEHNKKMRGILFLLRRYYGCNEDSNCNCPIHRWMDLKKEMGI